MHYCNDCFATFPDADAFCPSCKSPDVKVMLNPVQGKPADGVAKPGQLYFELRKGEQDET